MDTLKTRPSSLRRRHIACGLGLMVLTLSVLGLFLCWPDSAREACFVSIRVAGYDAPVLAHREPTSGELAASNVLKVGSSKPDIEQALGSLAQRGQHPIVVYLSALARRGETGQIDVLPQGASPDDAATWLPLRGILTKLQACPSQHKLLVLDLTPAPAQLGHLYHDLAAALPRELEAVPDAQRLVLCAASAGQTSHRSDELGQSVFGYYFQEALRGHARKSDGRVTVKTLAAFVQAHVDRWTWHNRGERQTPMLLGAGANFTLATVDPKMTREAAPQPAARSYPDWLLDAWRARDSAFLSGQYRLTPRLFQQQQATLLALEQAWRAGQSSATLRKRWLAECNRLQDAMHRMSNDLGTVAAQPDQASGIVFITALADAQFDPATLQNYDRLLHPTANAVPASAEALRLRQLADLATQVNRDAWSPELAESLLRCTASAEQAMRLQPSVPGFVSLLDEPAQARHAGEVRLWTRGYVNLDEAKAYLATARRQFERLASVNERWRQCETLLDETLAELPWYVEAIEALPELRTPWEQAAAAARRLADALKTALDPTKSWDERVERLTALLAEAEKHAEVLIQHRQALHAPFGREALTKLRRQCRTPLADAATRRTAMAILSVATPMQSAEDRAALGQACEVLSRRLNEETLAQDRQDNATRHPTQAVDINAPIVQTEADRARLRASCQLTLLELAGASAEMLRPARQRLERCLQDANNPAAWCKLGALLRRLDHEQLPQRHQQEPAWRERERLVWLLPCLEKFAGIDDAAISPTVERRRRDKDRHDQWLQAHRAYLARDYQGLNCENSAIVAARGFYARAAKSDAAPPPPAPSLRMRMTGSSEALTRKTPYAELTLEVTVRQPAGVVGPIELRVHCAHATWLEVAPALVSLPVTADLASHKVPLKVRLRPGAEGSGVPPPTGFLIEARLNGHSYHHLVTTPIVPDAQELQILVSADSNAPTRPLNELRIRPGKVPQPHYCYVKNLTNRPQALHFELRAGTTLLHKTSQPLTLRADSVHRIDLGEPAVKLTELTGPLTVRVLDQDGQRLLHQRSLAVKILSPRDYIKIADVSYEPGRQGQSKWTIQVEATRPIVGPAIAAQLVLPMQRIPGLIGIGGGTMQVEVPTFQSASRTLFADGIRLVRGAEEEGPVYLNIDGVPRAFVYRTTFSRAGAASQPIPDDRPAVRLVAPACVKSGINLVVDAEVDNAPKGTKLEIALGRLHGDGSFKAELVREFNGAKNRRIDLEASKGALTFKASISDWTAAFDTRSIAGARTLQARLLDVGGKALATHRQPLILDDSPPVARFMPTVAAVKKGSVLHVQAHGHDPESGVAQVVFFFGQPQNGSIPPGVPRFRAIPASRDRSMWTAALLIPADHKGPLTLSVHVLNNAGLASFDTITLEVDDESPDRP